MSFSVVIPARYASTRLPAKALREIHGKPLVQHVYERVQRSQAERIIIATDDERIADAARRFGADVEMTAAHWTSGTERIAQVARIRGWNEDHIVVNVQGDEPLIPPTVIDQVAANLHAHPVARIATLQTAITDINDVFDPNVVKVVSDHDGYALYFSRAPIPWNRDEFANNRNLLPRSFVFQRHIGLYAYRCGFLMHFAERTASPLEAVESLEQLRALWYGDKIHVATASELPGPGVDTPEDLIKVTKLIKSGL